MIITHGWPGSIIEQLKVIAPLTDPVAYGGKAEDAFDVVIPSLPGHGFSGKPTEPGWDPVRIAKTWIVLMKRLGYQKFVAQDGSSRRNPRRSKKRWRQASCLRISQPTKRMHTTSWTILISTVWVQSYQSRQGHHHDSRILILCI